MKRPQRIINMALALVVALTSVGVGASPAFAHGKEDQRRTERKEKDREPSFGKIALNGEVMSVSCDTQFMLRTRNDREATLSLVNNVTELRYPGGDAATCADLRAGLKVHVLAWRSTEQLTALIVQIPRSRPRFQHLISTIEAVSSAQIELSNGFRGSLSNSPTILPSGYALTAGDSVLVLAQRQGDGLPVVLLVVKVGAVGTPSPSPSPSPSPAATLSSEFALAEGNLDNRQLELNLSGVTFADSSLSLAGFSLQGAPAGLTIQSAAWISSTRATLTLDYDGTDFDDNRNLGVSVAGSELSTSTALTTNALTVTAAVETAATAGVAADVAMTESNLDGRQLTLTLSGATFADNALAASSFTLNGAPAGVTVSTVNWVSSTQATLTLDYTGTDFDDNKNLSVTVAGSELSPGTALTTNALTVTAVVETAATASVAADVAMTESNLDGRQLTLTLSNATFVDSSLAPASFTLNGAPTGTTVSAINWVSSTQATLTLDYDGTDFDENKNLSVTVAGSELSSGTGLTTNALTVSATVEATASIAPETALSETNLNGRQLTLTLSGATFADNTLVPASFTLNGAPTGTTVSAATWASATQAALTLNHDGTDFDVNASLSVTVSAGELSTGPALTTNTLTVNAVVEAAATIAPDTALSETNLNGRQLTLTLSGAAFADNSLVPASFTLNGAPTGTTISGVTWVSNTQATLNLAHNGADFDANASMSVTIAAGELSPGSALTSNTVTVTAVVD